MLTLTSYPDPTPVSVTGEAASIAASLGAHLAAVACEVHVEVRIPFRLDRQCPRHHRGRDRKQPIGLRSAGGGLGLYRRRRPCPASKIPRFVAGDRFLVVRIGLPQLSSDVSVCKHRMALARISAGERGFEERTFSAPHLRADGEDLRRRGSYEERCGGLARQRAQAAALNDRLKPANRGAGARPRRSPLTSGSSAIGQKPWPPAGYGSAGRKQAALSAATFGNAMDDWHYYYILGIPFGSRLGRGRRDRSQPGRESERPSDLRDPLRDDEHFLGSRGFVAPVEEKL